MKYIRTKDEIIDIDNFINKKENYSIRSIKGTDEEKARFVYFMKCGIKQADTIQELCDEFVIENKPLPIIWSKKALEKDIMPKLKYYADKGYEVYGAIWTNKGLIYVTKMNKHGELELL